MPELPEVETVRRGLLPVLEDVRIIDVLVRRPDLRWPFPERMAQRLTGNTVQQLRRRSKYLLCDLSSGETLIVHLGMSGRILIRTPNDTRAPGAFHLQHPALEKHDHVVIDLESGDRVVFNDARRFGAMDLCESSAVDAHRLIRGLGPEPLGNAFDEDHLAAQFGHRNSPVKSVLLDQRVVSGLGNIYACEALFRAGISPRRKASRVAESRVRTLVPVIREVLREAIEAGGSSLKDFRQTDGELGYFQHSFKVYGREGQPCSTESCQDIVHRIVQSGRSSFYCPSCQR